jgi:HD-like signal output (HDOD) protein
MSLPAVNAGKQDSLAGVRNIFENRIKNGDLDLPLLPAVATELIALTSDLNANAEKLSSLIREDIALAGHVLKVANSPMYMPRSPIVSLQQAVAWLGMANLALIALTVSMRSGVFQVQGYAAEVKQIWKHARASALYGKEIARLRRHNVENAFLCGLLHTIGQPVILREITKLQKERGILLDWDAAKELIDEYQVPVGTLIADKWALPDQVKEAIIHYSNYSMASSPATLVMITCLADRLTTHLLDPDAMDEQAVRDHPVVQALNLYSEDIDALLEKGEVILSGED